MKKAIIALATLLSISISFNVFAMKNYPQDWVDIQIPDPVTEIKHDDKTLDYKWAWLNDEIVTRFRPGDRWNNSRENLLDMFNHGMLEGGHGLKDDGGKRDTYVGTWSQAADGTWFFVFDDSTIPIDITRIDGVLYAFNGYGELVDGYKYWNNYKTGPDGLVTCTEPEFLTYLETQYIPDCTSHE